MAVARRVGFPHDAGGVSQERDNTLRVLLRQFVDQIDEALIDRVKTPESRATAELWMVKDRKSFSLVRRSIQPPALRRRRTPVIVVVAIRVRWASALGVWGPSLCRMSSTARSESLRPTLAAMQRLFAASSLLKARSARTRGWLWGAVMWASCVEGDRRGGVRG